MKARHLRMEATFREKAISAIAKFGRRHKHLKFLCYPAVVVVAVAYQIFLFFKDNTKRFVATACVFGMFAASASFSYPAFSAVGGFRTGDDGAQVMGAVREELSLNDLLAQMEAQGGAEDYEATLSERSVSVEEVVDTESLKADGESEYGETDAAEVDALSLADFEGVSVAADTGESAEGQTVFLPDDWRIILVNKQHPIPEGYDFPLGDINRRMHCDERIIGNLLAMMQGALDDGIALEIRSPYRNMNRQEYLFGAHIEDYMGKGLSYMDAYSVTSQTVTVPNASEHQIGLAIDITSTSYSALNQGFAETKAGAWLAEHSYEYGFILRYPLGKEHITGIEFEPWHFRYVGVDAARVMKEEDLTLEEFWDRHVYR